jgi:outer membrane protein assembly factor BamD (BamD/ComL family)
MTTFADWRRRLLAVGLVTSSLLAVAVDAQSPEEFARRRLESGRAFLKAQNYGEALKDFDAVLQSYPTSSVADDALLEIAAYHLEIARDFVVADVRVKELIKTYPGADSAAMALVLEGRIALARGRDQEAVNTALASFDRVPRLFPGSEAVPASMYYGGEAARLGGNRAQAIQRFSQLATQFPNSPWTANALVSSAMSLTNAGQPVRAMEQLQRVRTQFPRSSEAQMAFDLNTVLYRLYLRAPAQPAFLFSGRTITGSAGKLRDVVDIAIDAESNVLVASNTGVVAYGAKGAQAGSIAAPEPQSVAFDRFGRVITVHETGLRFEGRAPVPLVPPLEDNRPRQLKLSDALVTASGDYLVADRDLKTILKFLPDGKYAGEYAKTIDVRRMVINDRDEVAALDGDSKSVSVFSREGKLLKQIPERGTGYQLRNPCDVAFDRFGHLYILDRAAVLVFSPDATKLLTTFTTKEKTPGAFGEGNALALDSAGRLYVFDGRTDSVKVYR